MKTALSAVGLSILGIVVGFTLEAATIAQVIAQQAGQDPLSGGGGWVGAGLLGCVLLWLLLKHLPDKDKQIAAIIDRFVENSKELQATFKADMAAERNSCERRFDVLAGSIKDLANALTNGQRKQP